MPVHGQVEVLTEIVSVERRQNSESGNPRFRLMTRTGGYNTKPDAQCNYGIREDASGRHPFPHQAKLTVERGQVIGIEYLE